LSHTNPVTLQEHKCSQSALLTPLKSTPNFSWLPFLISFYLCFLLPLFSLSEPSNSYQDASPQHTLLIAHHHHLHSDTATTPYWSLKFST
jgi:hypothetical protein